MQATHKVSGAACLRAGMARCYMRSRDGSRALNRRRAQTEEPCARRTRDEGMLSDTPWYALLSARCDLNTDRGRNQSAAWSDLDGKCCAARLTPTGQRRAGMPTSNADADAMTRMRTRANAAGWRSPRSRTNSGCRSTRIGCRKFPRSQGTTTSATAARYGSRSRIPQYGGASQRRCVSQNAHRISELIVARLAGFQRGEFFEAGTPQRSAP